MYSKHYMKRYPQPHGQPDFRERETGRGGEAEDISRPIDSLMQSIRIRVLVNGTNKDVRDRALEDLFTTGVTPDLVAQELRALAKRAPRDFPQCSVEQVICWAHVLWNNRARGL
ncbi:MAG: hypothetical protein G01um101425_146 [Candidatus Peregrinibacteria bacterium Gr01-1014_25]|nr:MAG: hypothetical protein G01um101425_146 [Candidatus Peregrinibacteria bacterium Gr01-1014_25]